MKYTSMIGAVVALFAMCSAEEAFVLKSPASSTATTPQDIADIVDRHNHFRRSVDAANMQIMKWNSELAEKAQELSDTCEFHHAMMEWEGSPYRRVGQNLYLGTTSAYVNAVNRWHDNEEPWYDYETGTCSGPACGHFTQVMWADTKEVGCGRTYCPVATDPTNGRVYSNAYIITCNYGPAGNYRGEKPYKLGDACSDCAGGSAVCNNGLCDAGCEGGECECNIQCNGHGTPNTDDCTCSCDDGWTGAQCQDVCEEFHDSCSTQWKEWQCRFKFISDKCPAMCGRCVLPSAGSDSVPVESEPEPVCEDKYSYCTAFPPTACKYYPPTAEACPRLCGKC